MLKSDASRTAARIALLDDYMRSKVLNDRSFVCGHHRACRSSHQVLFFPGQLHHVGRHFDLEKDGRELRIVAIGQEYGSPDVGVSLAERTESLSRGCAGSGFVSRNAHMRGTTSLLRLMFGMQPGTDMAGERLPDLGGDAHIFDAFALVNAVMCSAIEKISPQLSSPGAATGTMYANCGEHLRETLQILEPTVLVVQGVAVRSHLRHSLGLPERPWPLSEKVEVCGRSVTVFNFAHPSAPGSYGWWGGSIRSRYLVDKVSPTIRAWSQAFEAGSV